MNDTFDENLYDKVENYLNGRLSKEEAIQFDAALEITPELQEQVNLHKLEREVRERLIRTKMREQFEVWRDQQPKTDRSDWRRKVFLWALGAVVVAVGIYLWRKPESIQTAPSGTTPTVDTFQQQRDSVAQSQQRGGDTTPAVRNRDKPVIVADTRLKATLASLLEKDLKTYKSATRGNAQQADLNADIRRYQLTKPTDSLYLDHQSKLGRAWMHTDKYDQAMAVFRVLVAADSEKISQQSEWHLVLCLMQNPEIHQNEITARLERMTRSTDHLYAQEAVALNALWRSAIQRK